jgi:putative intracellular protease/amidase
VARCAWQRACRPQASKHKGNCYDKTVASSPEKADWMVHVVADGLLITGQNPSSSGPAAKTLIAALKRKRGPSAVARAS